MAGAKTVDPHADQRRRLTELRDKLEKAIESCSENMLPQLSGQYRATLADLAALPSVVAGPVSKMDELKERREAKRTPAPGRGAASAPAQAAGGKGRNRGA